MSEPTTITDWRQRRVEELIDYARKTIETLEIPNHASLNSSSLDKTENRYHSNHVIRPIRLLCFEYCKSKWRISDSLCNDYWNTARLVLKHEIAQYWNRYTAKANENELAKTPIQKLVDRNVSKEKLFMEVFRSIAGAKPGLDTYQWHDVPFEQLIEELVRTGQFSDELARSYVEKFNREGQIFERKIGCWAKA